MEKGNNGKAKVWVYAVILFTSAFIVLLITAYSQIKFTRNIDDYRTQINTKESEKNTFQLNLNSALKENEKLLNEVKELKEQLKKESEVVETQKSKIIDIESSGKSVIDSYEKLISAQIEYDKGNLENCVFILINEVKSEILSAQGLQKYNELIKKTSFKVAHELYKDGLNSYKNKQYSDAIESFGKSFEISDSEYFSDDCLYLTAYSKYKQGYRQEALAYYKKLLDRYPNSDYAKNSEAILKKFGN